MYILEAHFVERDARSGRVLDGWPIGYEQFEFPQHRSVQDRLSMARRSLSSLRFLTEVDEVCVDGEGNDFNNALHAWPDQLFAFDTQSRALVFRGQQRADGSRSEFFSDQLESFMQRYG